MNGVAMTLRFEVFPSDLDATADFCTRVLRFEVSADRRREPRPYMAFGRDAARIGAARHSAIGLAGRPHLGELAGASQ
jgi:hypothetical protein